jgi:hypothetical protein
MKRPKKRPDFSGPRDRRKTASVTRMTRRGVRQYGLRFGGRFAWCFGTREDDKARDKEVPKKREPAATPA